MATKVEVSFSFYDIPYAEWPERIPLGVTNWRNAKHIVNILRTHQPDENSCIHTMTACATQTYRGEFDRGYNDDRHDATLDISEIFSYTDTFRTPCMNANERIPLNNVDMIKKCAKKFCAGKCRDKFMRQTLGTILYPQFYADKKVKGK